MSPGKWLLAMFALVIPATVFSQISTFDPANAEKAVGTLARVCGMVSQVHYSPKTSGQPTFINMGGRYPQHRFTAVIWGSSLQAVRLNAQSLDGKYTCIDGAVENYRGKPSITVTASNQIRQGSK